MTKSAPLFTNSAGAPEGGRAVWLRSGNTPLRAAIWGGGRRGTALIFNGRTEYIEKYGPVITALRERGFNIATLDWRGQGLSGRALSNPLKGHVEDFSRYQDDVRAFMAADEVKALAGPHLLICHSMGGCIGTRALLEGHVKPAGVVFSAPMLGLHLSGPARFAARVMTRLASLFGGRGLFRPGPGASKPYILTAEPGANTLTSDHANFIRFREQLEKEPRFQIAGPTLGWLGAAFDEMRALSRAPAPDAPALYMLGSDEEIVSPKAVRAQAARHKGARLLELSGARHEAFFETEVIRDQLWREIDGFLKETGL